jgi:hypothetical protein
MLLKSEQFTIYRLSQEESVRLRENVTAICRYRGRVGTGLSVLWVAYATRSTLEPVPTLPR